MLGDKQPQKGGHELPVSVPPLYPVYLNLAGRRCLVVGAGNVAWRKIQGLTGSGAAVTVVAPAACEEVRQAAGRGEVRLVEADFTPELLDGMALCVTATDDAGTNARVAAEAKSRGVLVNVVDSPELCDFEAPAVVRRGRLQVAVSSGGASPLLASRLKRELEERYGPEYGLITSLLGRARAELRRRESSAEARLVRLQAAVDRALDPEVVAAAREGREADAEREILLAAGLAAAPGRLLRVGCRGSGLARRQAELVVEALRASCGSSGDAGDPAPRFELVTISTGGDLDVTTPLADLSTVGTFTNELERALLHGQIDLAVHSLKDLPTAMPAGLVLAAVTTRADPRDAIISRSGRGLAGLPPGGSVGTSSPRRAALVRRLRPDLECRPLRGNVDTRLRRLDEGAYDAIVLAAAGLERLGLAGRVNEYLDPETFVPAPAQGFLAVECRADDQDAVALASRIDDAQARLAAEAERAFLHRLGAGCHAAAGAYARIDPGKDRLDIVGLALSEDGSRSVDGRRSVDGPLDRAAAVRAGAGLAEDLLKRGAAELVRPPAAQGPRKSGPGIVYLVGAGPGDPGLLTLKGADLLARADCVVVDRLANPSLLARTPPGCEIILAGKEPGRHSITQEGISRLLVEKAGQGLNVVRLKGGDPFVFGRGGEEAQALRAAGVCYEVVPGVTSAVAGPAYAGIPVTHRGKAQSFAVVTGHGEGGGKDTPDFARLASAVDTIVVLMGTGRLADIVDQMLRGDRPPSTPACVVASATTAEQRVVSGTLGDIAGKAAAAGVSNPALIIVGEVAALRDELAWREDLPLAGRRIVVTRTREQASLLSERLRSLGADVFTFPAVRVERPQPGSPELRRLDSCLERLDDFDWIVFTSVNGVDIFFERLTAVGLDTRTLSKKHVAAIGPATADRLLRRGVRADLVPEAYEGEALARAVGEAAGLAGGGTARPARVLLVRSSLGRRAVVDELGRRGLEVEEVHAYGLGPETDSPARAALRDDLAALLRAGRVDALTFASSETVRQFMRAVGHDWLAVTPRRPAVFCIGPVTAKTSAEVGLDPSAVARDYTVDGLVEAVLDHYRERTTQGAGPDGSPV